MHPSEKYKQYVKNKYGFTNRQFYVYYSLLFCNYRWQWPEELRKRCSGREYMDMKTQISMVVQWILDGEPQ